MIPVVSILGLQIHFYLGGSKSGLLVKVGQQIDDVFEIEQAPLRIGARSRFILISLGDGLWLGAGDGGDFSLITVSLRAIVVVAMGLLGLSQQI